MVYLTKLLAASSLILAAANAAPTVAPGRTAAVVNPPKIGYEFENRSQILLKCKNPETNKNCQTPTTSLRNLAKGAPLVFNGLKNKVDWAPTIETVGVGLFSAVPEVVVDGGSATKGAGVPLTAAVNVGERVGRELNEFFTQVIANYHKIDPATKKRDPKNAVVAVDQEWTRAGATAAELKDLRAMEWDVSIADTYQDVSKVGWNIQVTAAFPLGAYKDIVPQFNADQDEMTMAYRKGLSPLVTKANHRVGYIPACLWPFKDLNAKHMPELLYDDIDIYAETDISADLLGYVSFLLSYINGNRGGSEAQGPKHSTSIMPRTDFKAMYYDTGLYIEMNRLIAEYSKKTTLWNSGRLPSKPHPISDFTSLLYAICLSAGMCDQNTIAEFKEINFKWEGGVTVSAFDFLNDIAAKPAGIDLVSQADLGRHGQIGGLKNKFEYAVGGTAAKPLPIFEFRDIDGIMTPALPAYLERLENNLKSHYANALARRALTTPKSKAKAKTCSKVIMNWLKPVKGKPTTTAPGKTAPTTTAGAKTPVKTAPVKTAPVKTAPVKTAPVKTAPVKTAPVKTAPVKKAGAV